MTTRNLIRENAGCGGSSANTTAADGAASMATTTRRSFLRVAGAAGALALAGLTGCAPDATSSSTSDDDSDAEEISVTVANSNPPYCSVDTDGTPIGYDVEVLKAVDDYLEDYSFSIDAMDFSAMVTACQSGSSPLVSCQLVPTDERKETFLFPDEPFSLAPMVFATADPDCKTLEDMAGKTVLGDTINYAYSILSAYNEKYPDQAVVLETIQNVTSADIFRKIASGQADAMLIVESSFDTVNEEAETGLYKSDVVFVTSTYLMFNQNYTELCDAVNEAIVALKEDGTLSALSEEYVGVDVFTEYADALTDTELLA